MTLMGRTGEQPPVGTTAPVSPTPLARLLAMAYGLLINDLHQQLRQQGWRDVRPAFGFVLLALRDTPLPLRELTTVLGTTKQAVSQLVDGMVAAGYAERAVDPDDARAKLVGLTTIGHALLVAVESVYRDLEGEWSQIVGEESLAQLKLSLETVLRKRHDGALPAVRPTA